jgi:hypothetical protein
MYSANVLPPFSLPEVRENLVADDPKHLLALAELAKVGPAELLLVRPEDPLEWLLGPLGLLLVAGLGHVEQTRKHEERDLLDDR